MSNREEHGRGRSGVAIAVIGVLVLAIPLLYVLSVGPAAYVYDRIDDSSALATTLQTIYAPLGWVSEQSSLTRDALNWYLSVWQS